MKTTIKILIVAALVGAVIAAVALKPSPNKAPAESTSAAATAATNSAALSSGNPVIPGANAKLPKLLDLGAGKCIPCKMMTPILEELKSEYAGRMNVEFIDVWVNPDAAKPYGIEVIPTQIFFDADGKELFRHVGFFAKADILGKWQELGVDLATRQSNQP